MRITKHAKIRMDERGISEDHIKMVLTHGKQLVNRNDPNKWTYVLNGTKDIYVITNKESDTVITVFTK